MQFQFLYKVTGEITETNTGEHHEKELSITVSELKIRETPKHYKIKDLSIPKKKIGVLSVELNRENRICVEKYTEKSHIEQAVLEVEQKIEEILERKEKELLYMKKAVQKGTQVVFIPSNQ